MNIYDTFLGELFSRLLEYVFSRRNRYYFSFRAWLLRETEIRISDSYLYRIMIDNEYLLIKGNKLNQYQPIGGVFKVFDSFKETKENLGIRFEANKNFYEDNDLRLIIKGKNILKYDDWFNSRKNRETNVYREFMEEIIDTNILPIEAMREIKIEYLKTEGDALFKSTYYGYESKRTEIYEVKIPEIYHEKLINHPDLLLVEDADIKRCTINIKGKEERIGEHTINIL